MWKSAFERLMRMWVEIEVDLGSAQSPLLQSHVVQLISINSIIHKLYFISLF